MAIPSNSLTTETPHARKSKVLHVHLAITAALGSFSFGFQLAIISGVLPLAAKEFMLTSAKEGFLVSTILLGALLGVCIAGVIADKLGRKPSLQIHAALFIIGTVLCANCTSFALLVAGRLISGLALGLVSTLVPLYLSEISPATWRGRIVSGNQIMMALGILMCLLCQLQHGLVGIMEDDACCRPYSLYPAARFSFFYTRKPILADLQGSV
jgi:SP family arabinose:H+ symporter-like MFS transporter